MTALQTISNGSSDVTTFRAAKAARIKELSQRWAESTIALGSELSEVRDTFPPTHGGVNRPGWHDWVKTNTGWQPDHAGKFIRIFERCGRYMGSSNKTSQFVAIEVLSTLARADTPESAVKDVMDRINRGDKVTIEDAKQLVAEHRPSPAQARKQARDTGKLVAASDGNVYSGATIDEERAYSERRSIIYGTRRSVDFIADCELTPKQWIDSTEDAPHWINEFRLANVDAAIKWLTKLRPLLEKKLGIING